MLKKFEQDIVSTEKKQDSPKEDEWEKVKRFLIRLLLHMLPSVLLMFVLFTLFPHTGLGRILTVPATLLVNLLIAVAVVVIPYQKLWFRILKFISVTVLTCWITIAWYPQDSMISIEEQTQEMVRAVQDIDNITRDDLVDRARFEDPRYVVALHKYLDEIPFDGTYQLYRHPNPHGRDYTIHKPSDIPAKLKSHHKPLWLYLNLFEK